MMFGLLLVLLISPLAHAQSRSYSYEVCKDLRRAHRYMQKEGTHLPGGISISYRDRNGHLVRMRQGGVARLLLMGDLLYMDVTMSEEEVDLVDDIIFYLKIKHGPALPVSYVPGSPFSGLQGYAHSIDDISQMTIVDFRKILLSVILAKCTEEN
ncbi:MAG: hypothetical protein R3A11_09180 [Bdellovibrionota bacterium]